MSWLPVDQGSTFIRFIYNVTDPILEPFRIILSRFMPRGPGFYLDFSPVIALIVLNILRQAVINILLRVVI